MANYSVLIDLVKAVVVLLKLVTILLIIIFIIGLVVSSDSLVHFLLRFIKNPLFYFSSGGVMYLIVRDHQKEVQSPWFILAFAAFLYVYFVAYLYAFMSGMGSFIGAD